MKCDKRSTNIKKSYVKEGKPQATVTEVNTPNFELMARNLIKLHSELSVRDSLNRNANKEKK